jgi:hypothetical protein
MLSADHCDQIISTHGRRAAHVDDLTDAEADAYIGPFSAPLDTAPAADG